MNKPQKTTHDKKVADKEIKPVEFKGEYISVIGRRKTSSAQVRLYKNGTGNIIVNGMPIAEYFPGVDSFSNIQQPLKLSGHIKDLDFMIVVKGGGKMGQVVAVRHGITRAIVKMEPELRATFKVKGLLTRDARKKERKKPGLKKARKRPQWSKR